MASTKPSASTSSTSKGTNPAPDFTLAMNRIQTQFETQFKRLRKALPQSHSGPQTNTVSNPKTFSALSTNTSSTTHSKSPTQLQSQDSAVAAAAAARRKEQEAEIAADQNLDPNSGLGLIPRGSAATNGNESGRDRETARLRGRLLGKRGRNGGNMEQYKRVRKEESSEDEEAGRSGLGRTKRNGKRRRTEVEEGNDEGERKEGGDRVEAIAPPEDVTRNQDDAADGPEGGADALSSKPVGEPEGKSKKKRKRNKKKSKNKTNGD